MAGRTPLSTDDEQKVREILPEKFGLRDQALIVTGLNTGFRITELLSLNVGQVYLWASFGVFACSRDGWREETCSMRTVTRLPI